MAERRVTLIFDNYYSSISGYAVYKGEPFEFLKSQKNMKIIFVIGKAIRFFGLF